MDINEITQIKLLEDRNKFILPDGEKREIKEKRDFFKVEFNAENIRNLDKEHYFQGKGVKKGNFTYELEWNSKCLGGIGGGSVYKFGYEEDFNHLKKFIATIISAADSYETFYDEANLTNFSAEIITQSKLLKGVKRAFVGKVLSIYFPDIFLSIFGHQEFYLERLFNDYNPEYTGVELYFRNNLLLLNYKKKYFSDLSNDEFVYLLYKSFEIKRSTDPILNTNERIDEERVQALEVDHYQSLIHRNFSYLFKNQLTYYDEDYQGAHNGHFATDEVGTLDFLAKDTNDNFVVIELKKDSTDKTLGQILRYMGWVKENLCKEKQDVRGLIIAESKDNRLDYALKVISNVEFKKMKLYVEIQDI